MVVGGGGGAVHVVDERLFLVKIGIIPGVGFRGELSLECELMAFSGIEEEVGIGVGLSGGRDEVGGEVREGLVRGDDGGDGGARWHVGVDEVGASARATH